MRLTAEINNSKDPFEKISGVIPGEKIIRFNFGKSYPDICCKTNFELTEPRYQ